MGSLFGGKKPAAPVILNTTTPTIIDNSKETQALEQARKKRQGAAMAMIAGNTSLSGNSVRKTTLGE